jgi:putative aldouronate transport system substrate-binding protein
MKTKMIFALMIFASIMVVYGGGGKDAGSATGTGPGASREVSLCMSQIRFGYSVDEKMMQAWTAVIEKATNTKIEIISPTHNDFNEKLNVLLSSGSYPDIIRPQQSWDTVSQYAVRGYLQPVTQYIKNDPRFAQLKNLDLSMYTSSGEIYGLPTGKGNCKIIWFRKDMVDKYNLNIKDSMTIDEFVTELKKVDKRETIPFSFPKWIVNFQIFYNFFGAYGGILPGGNGAYYDGIQADQMKQALLWVKGLYDQGLLDPEFITNENANMREKLCAGKAAADIDYTSRYSYYVQTSGEVGASTDFIPVYTLTGPGGKFGNLNESGNEAMCLSSTNKNVEASMDIINYLFFTEEGRKLDALSVEGVHYDIADRILVPRKEAVSSGYSIEYNRLSDGWAEVPFKNLGFSFQGISDEVLSNMLNYTAKALGPQYLGPMIKIPMGFSPLYDENVASYNANLYEMATKIVLGTQSIDAAYADYARFWRSINGDEMIRQLNSRSK